MDGRTAPAVEFGIQIPDAKVATAEEGDGRKMVGRRRRWEVAGVALRVTCAASSVVSLCLMVTAEQHGELSLFGFHLPLYSKWSFADSFEYLVGIAAAAAAHSVLQLALSSTKLLKRAPVVASRRHAWVLFAGDQIFAYALVSAGSAAAGVTNLNRTGIRHSALPDFCMPLRRFCNRMAMSISFTFLSFLLLAASALLDVLWLLKY